MEGATSEVVTRGRWAESAERSREPEMLGFKGNWVVEGGAVVVGAWVEGGGAWVERGAWVVGAWEEGMVSVEEAMDAMATAAERSTLALIPRR